MYKIARWRAIRRTRVEDSLLRRRLQKTVFCRGRSDLRGLTSHGAEDAGGDVAGEAVVGVHVLEEAGAVAAGGGDDAAEVAGILGDRETGRELERGEGAAEELREEERLRHEPVVRRRGHRDRDEPEAPDDAAEERGAG